MLPGASRLYQHLCGLGSRSTHARELACRAPKQNPAAWRSGEAPSPRRHDLAFHVLTAYCLVPQIEMPFGKNKQLAYKRPKKGKVPALEESSENTENAGINGGGQPPPAPTM
eukprot:3473174-Prymnesium_polylepis.1